MASILSRAGFPFLRRRHINDLGRRVRAWRMVRQYDRAVRHGAPYGELVQLLPAPERPVPLWVQLRAITRFGDTRQWPKAGLHWCLPGDWDLELTQKRWSIHRPVTEADKETLKWRIHDTVRAMFIHGRPYTETSQYEAMVAAVITSPPEPDWGCRTVGEVHAYFEKLRSTFTSMKQHGYLAHWERQPDVNPLDYDELPLFILRDGSLCQGNAANHRVKIAELLGIQWVSATLRKVHPQWALALCHRYQRPPGVALHLWFRDNPALSISRPVDHHRRALINGIPEVGSL
ncbi:hypothetical protein ACNSTU_11215 [Aquisalimonas sp. APHAB1-3]|uniref:hypothetical protein n=1 Tax=Aquisalimonas sp. APHAB1-3 TaxID=3402080 RepID=UPI003AAA248E